MLSLDYGLHCRENEAHFYRGKISYITDNVTVQAVHNEISAMLSIPSLSITSDIVTAIDTLIIYGSNRSYRGADTRKPVFYGQANTELRA
ncbi:MAG: hypothetical protein JKY67_10125 [Pseudomonadales bacterium]|nr:hypothetical protein [Pseudomonadales bacterium]